LTSTYPFPPPGERRSVSLDKISMNTGIVNLSFCKLLIYYWSFKRVIG
jgi:hypothetical protein